MDKTKKILTKILLYFVEIFVIVVSIFPILWVIASSFKTNGEILSSPLALPSSISFEPYIHLFQEYNFPIYFLNSLLAAGISTFVSLLFYAMGGYVIAKFRFPGRGLLFALFTVTLLVPGHSRTQPIFSLITQLNLYDSIWGVTVVYLSAGMAMSIFVLKAGFMAIPASLDEAAGLEGCGFFRTFWSINLPLAKSALSTAGILMFLERILFRVSAHRFRYAAHAADRAGFLHQRILLQLYFPVRRADGRGAAGHHPVRFRAGAGAGQRRVQRRQGLMIPHRF